MLNRDQWPFPAYENGDIFLSWGEVATCAYVQYDPSLAVRYVKNVLDQYEKDGLAFQRYLRKTQRGAGNDILSGNALPVVGPLVVVWLVAALPAAGLRAVAATPQRSDLGPVRAGGFYLTHGLPDPYGYHAFGDGDLSLTVEPWGGINSILALDVLSHDGKLYPDRGFTPPLLQKEGNRCGKRALYGPGLQFISTQQLPDGRKGRNLLHFPQAMELYPFGFRSHCEEFGHQLGYDLCLDGRSILFRLTKDRATARRTALRGNQRFETILRAHIEAAAAYSRQSPQMEIESIPAAGGLLHREKLLRYMIFIPTSGLEGDLADTPHLMVTVEDLVACSGDTAFLREVFPALKRLGPPFRRCGNRHGPVSEQHRRGRPDRDWHQGPGVAFLLQRLVVRRLPRHGELRLAQAGRLAFLWIACGGS